MKLLYLHGFRSSPDSEKAISIITYCCEHGLPRPIVPQLPISPKDSIEICERIIDEHQVDAICGSSLGGFYAMYLAEKYKLPCALINPAITPWREFKNTSLHSRYKIDEVSSEDVERFLMELMCYETLAVTDLSRYMLLATKDDEVLDIRQMRDHFKQAEQIILETGGHSLNDFGGCLDQIMGFLKLQTE